ncbi:unnamed protein product, partial [Tetraodon nigroviridis]
CWSYVGRQGGRQDVSLQARGCLYHEVVQHEVLHALGFHHEQVRSDRDNYIRILTENIIPGGRRHTHTCLGSFTLISEAHLMRSSQEWSTTFRLRRQITWELRMTSTLSCNTRTLPSPKTARTPSSLRAIQA